MDFENKDLEKEDESPHYSRRRRSPGGRQRLGQSEDLELFDLDRQVAYRRGRGRRERKIYLRSIARKMAVLLGLFLAVIVLVIIAILFVRRMRRSSGDGTLDASIAQDASQSLTTDEYGNPIYSDEEIMGRTDLSSEQKRLLGIRNSLESGDSVLDTLRRFFPDSLVVSKDSRYIFKDIDSSLKMNDYETSEVSVLPTGEYIYERNGEVISRKGIDISSHQGEIDWEKVAGTDLEFVFMRALYRGYESGKLVEDERFKINLEGAMSQGIKTGVYIFTQAVTEAEVDEELDMLEELLNGTSLTLPVVVDVEEAGGGLGRMDQLSIKERTSLIKYYCESIKERGYTPMIYFNINGAVLMLDIEELEDYEKWFAVYDNDFYYPYAYSVWQYSDSGSVDGIEGDVDLDLSFMDF